MYFLTIRYSFQSLSRGTYSEMERNKEWIVARLTIAYRLLDVYGNGLISLIFRVDAARV